MKFYNSKKKIIRHVQFNRSRLYPNTRFASFCLSFGHPLLLYMGKIKTQ